MSNRELKTNRPKPGAGVRLNMRCRHCIHHRRQAYYDDVCVRLGVEGHAIPCTAFSVDPSQLNTHAEGMSTAMRIIRGLPTEQLDMLSAILKQEPRNRKQGYRLGQVVFFRLNHGRVEYLSDYAAARVVSSDRDYVYLRGREGYVASLPHTSVLTTREWEKKRADLQAAGRLKGAGAGSVTLQVLRGEYMPPVLTARQGSKLPKLGKPQPKRLPKSGVVQVR